MIENMNDNTEVMVVDGMEFHRAKAKKMFEFVDGKQADILAIGKE